MSPDQNIEVTCDIASASYSIRYKGIQVLKNSALGLVREDGDFSSGLTLDDVSEPVTIHDQYTIVTSKKSNITYTATQRIFHTISSSGEKMDIVFQVSSNQTTPL